ncbi:hypothetical protein ACN5L1_004387 [Cronobacter turicensis]
MAGFELANVGRTDMRENIKLKIAKNARSTIFTPSLYRHQTPDTKKAASVGSFFFHATLYGAKAGLAFSFNLLKINGL